MECMRQDCITEQVCLGSVPAGSVVMFPNDDSPYLVTNDTRIKQIVGGSVDTIGVVACDTGTMFWFSDRYDVIPVKDATLVYRLAGKGVSKHD